MANDYQHIQFHFVVPPFHFPNRTALKQFLTKQFKGEGKEVEAINYIFCDDSYLLQINQQYLQHDTYTDIITFELSPKAHPLVSDIYISVERVKENAVSHRVSFKNELHRVIFHGALHLCGLTDKTKEQAATMRQREDEWLGKYLVPRGTALK
ncbi:MAG TPA: rRNA maturation RNase YbeY [Flavisolibacter sp.]|nr:rRNA maturation RNase YbeY [Flavisolibacter sp.]